LVHFSLVRELPGSEIAKFIFLWFGNSMVHFREICKLLDSCLRLSENWWLMFAAAATAMLATLVDAATMTSTTTSIATRHDVLLMTCGSTCAV